MGVGVAASGTSGPSESVILQKLPEFAQVNPWATKFIANPRLVAVRPHGHDGAEDTPPAGPMNGDEHPVSPPAAPVANLDVSTPERSIPDPSPSQLPPSTSNVATTQPPASVTPQARGSSTLSPERACNMCTCSGNGTQELAVQDLLCLVDLYLVYLI